MRNAFFYLAIITLFIACSQTPLYNITGDITGIEGTIYLTHKIGEKWIKADSTELIDGKFTFDGSVIGPEQYYLTFKNKRASIPFIIENSAININADLKDLASAEITGSASQDIMNNYNNGVVAVFLEKDNKLGQAHRQAAKAKDKKKMEEMFAEHFKIMEERYVATKNFIINNNKSFAAALIASHQIRGKEADEIDELVALLDASLMEIDLVIGMKEKAEALRVVSIGKIAPDFTLNDTEGESVTLSSLLGKGYLLIDFWASWCGPCRMENPNVVEAYNKYHAKGFEVIGISLDGGNVEDWKKAIIEDNLPWINVLDYTNGKSEVTKSYVVQSIPTNFLLDKEGKIIAKNLRGEALKEKLAELLN